MPQKEQMEGRAPGELGLSSVINLLCDIEQSSFFPGAQFSCHGNEQRHFLSTQLKKKERVGTVRFGDEKYGTRVIQVE